MLRNHVNIEHCSKISNSIWAWKFLGTHVPTSVPLHRSSASDIKIWSKTWNAPVRPGSQAQRSNKLSMQSRKLFPSGNPLPFQKLYASWSHWTGSPRYNCLKHIYLMLLTVHNILKYFSPQTYRIRENEAYCDIFCANWSNMVEYFWDETAQSKLYVAQRIQFSSASV